jgi:hypothetical protein
LKFGDDVKGFTIGEKRPEKAGEGIGPGHYSPERAESLTKSKTPAVVFSKEPSRPQSFANRSQIEGVSPGQYDGGKDFLSDVKGFKIGEKRPQKPDNSLGPGHYSPERAESVTKSRSPTALFSKQASRPQSFANPSQIGGVSPGQYDEIKPQTKSV